MTIEDKIELLSQIDVVDEDECEALETAIKSLENQILKTPASVSIGNNQEEVLKRAISTYGTYKQVDMAIEEMSELTKALCKERRYDLKQGKHAETVKDIIEEIADVSIMLRQLLIIFDRDDEVQEQIEYKINRLEKRLQEHKEEL
jgi:NTP pyrophosphatase (non-canonical NTP hydrolase)